MRTKTEERDEFVPTALRQVWQWKEALHRETERLSTAQALRSIHQQAAEIVRQLNLRVAALPEAHLALGERSLPSNEEQD